MEAHMSRTEIEKLNYLWHIVGNQLKEEMSNEKYSYITGLSMVEMSILQIIEKNPKIIFKEICTQLGLPKSTLTSAVNRLEKRGLVKRNPLQQDKRAFFLELTASGFEAQREHVLIEYVVFERLLQGLEEQEEKTFVALLSKALKIQ